MQHRKKNQNKFAQLLQKIAVPFSNVGCNVVFVGILAGRAQHHAHMHAHMHAKGTTNKSHHTFRTTHHSQSGSPHLHSPVEQHAPLVPLSCLATAKGTTNKSHDTQKAQQTKATTRSGLPITLRVGAKGTTNKSHHTFRPTHHSQSPSPHLHSPLEQHAPLVPLSSPGTAKGTTNERHHTQKAPQTKATTRSGLPIIVRVRVPICIHHLSNMHLLCLCLAQPPQKAPQTKATTRRRHHKQKPPHVQAYPSLFRPTHHSQSRSPHLHSPREQHAPLVPLSCPAT